MYGGLLGQGVLDDMAFERLLREADDAFEALEVLLGNEEFFGDVKEPKRKNDSGGGGRGEPSGQDTEGRGVGNANILDAAVFAYTHVILSLFDGPHMDLQAETTPARRLARSVRDREALVRHRELILTRYYRPSNSISKSIA